MRTAVDTPIFSTLAEEHGVDHLALTDLSVEAIERRAIPEDRERGARLVARLADLEAEK